MTQIAQDWRIEIVQAHPRLFDFMQDEPKDTFGYPLCSEGWRDVLERLCGRIEEALRENETFEFVRIKQKFGSCVLAGKAMSWRKPGPPSKRPSHSLRHAAAARASSAARKALSITLTTTCWSVARSTPRAGRYWQPAPMSASTLYVWSDRPSRPFAYCAATTASPTASLGRRRTGSKRIDKE